jgi:hypothetical protein
MKVFLAVVMLFVITFAAYAADIDGKWTGSFSGPQGDIPVAFTLKADGDKLTGTTMGLDGTDVAIKDGKIDGNNITFTVTYDFAGMPLVLSYKGVVAADQIKMTADFAGMPFEFVVKKSK